MNQQRGDNQQPDGNQQRRGNRTRWVLIGGVLLVLAVILFPRSSSAMDLEISQVFQMAEAEQVVEIEVRGDKLKVTRTDGQTFSSRKESTVSLLELLADREIATGGDGIKIVVETESLANGTVYFGSDDEHLYAVDIQTGQEKWRFKTDGEVNVPSAVADGTVFFGSNDDYLYAVDTESGQEKWRFETDSNVIFAPVIADGTVFFGSNDDYLYALDTESGQEKWRFETERDTSSRSNFRIVDSSPAIGDGTIFFGHVDYLFAVDIETGQEKWKFES